MYLIHRRDTFRGEEATVNKLKERENVKFILNSTVTKLNADRRLQSIEVTNKDGDTQTIEVNGLFTAIGRIPENKSFADVVTLDSEGYIKGVWSGVPNQKALEQLVQETMAQ